MPINFINYAQTLLLPRLLRGLLLTSSRANDEFLIFTDSLSLLSISVRFVVRGMA